jgi:hypothetical protein
MSRQREAGRSIEPMIWVSMIAIMMAFLIPVLVNRPNPRDLMCMIHMIRLTDGKAKPDGKCPVSDTPYRITGPPASKVIACPDPDDHLPTKPRFVQAGTQWRFTQTLPQLRQKAQSSVELSDGLMMRTLLFLDKKECVVIEKKEPGFIRYVIAPLLLLVILYLLIAVATEIWESHSLLGLPLGFLIFALFLGYLLYSILHEEVIEIPAGGNRVIVKDLYWGKEIGKPRVIEGVRALCPVRKRNFMAVTLFYEKKGRLESKALFSLNRDELAWLGPVHRALFPPARRKKGSRKAKGTREAEGSRKVEDTRDAKGSREAKDGR